MWLAIAPTGSAVVVWLRSDSERREIWACHFLPDVGSTQTPAVS